MRALKIATLLLIAAGIIGLSYGGIRMIQARRAIDAARRENRALKAQREVLRAQAFDLAGRLLEGMEREHRMARLAGTPGRVWEGQRVVMPARGSGDEALQAWFSERGVWVDARGLSEAATPPQAIVVRAPLATGAPEALTRNATVLLAAPARH